MNPIQQSALVFRDVRVFDGRSEELAEGRTVVAVGDRLREIGGSGVKPPAGATVIEGRGRVLMPGMIDCHYHAVLAVPLARLLTTTPTHIGAAAKIALENTLRRGFTTVRDAAGADFGLAQAVDEGLIEGPRLYHSGRAISQTGGHGDFRPPTLPHPALGMEALRDQGGFLVLADGPTEVRRFVREELRLGAKQIKIMASGGVASPSDPIHTLQYSPEEIRAACETAADWDTYVLAHAYTPGAIRRCLENGVRSIEHANLIDDDTARLAAERDAFVVPNLVAYWSAEQDPAYPPIFQSKLRQVWETAERSLEILKRAGVKLAIGTDLIGPGHAWQSRELGLRRSVFSPVEILRQATSLGGELVARSGKLNPWGPVGVIEEGAMADVLLVDGDPLSNLAVLEEPEKNLAVIVRGGRVIKHEAR